MSGRPEPGELVYYRGYANVVCSWGEGGGPRNILLEYLTLLGPHRVVAHTDAVEKLEGVASPDATIDRSLRTRARSC